MEFNLKSEYKEENETVKTNLTLEERENYLGPLKDVCTIMPTRFFLYEFCYQKYAKQFDDANTMFWGNKQSPETYFLGQHENYNITTVFIIFPFLNYVLFLKNQFKNFIKESKFLYSVSIVPFVSVVGRVD